MASEQSFDAIGWFAAFVGAIGFGSFAVPIKGNAANSVDIDPLVMQSYKSLMCLCVTAYVTVPKHSFFVYVLLRCSPHSCFIHLRFRHPFGIIP